MAKSDQHEHMRACAQTNTHTHICTHARTQACSKKSSVTTLLLHELEKGIPSAEIN